MAPGNHNRNHQKRPVLKLGCCNVRTMMTDLSASLQDIKDSRKTAVINDELRRLNVDIATLHETRLADSGTPKEKDDTFFWQGKRSDEPREHGVGFAVRNSLLRMVEPGSGGSQRLLSLRLNSTTGPVTLISVYTPTLSTTTDTKDMFYENLTSIIRNTPSKEQRVLLVDCNARVGADHDSWPSCLGQFGVGKMNETGQRLLELCTFHDLCITNSSFRTKPQHKVSWRHPRSKHWHQLDLILVRRAAIMNVLHTRSYYSADCDTDYSFVCCKIRMQPKKCPPRKDKGEPSYRCQQDASTKPHGAVRSDFREGIRRLATEKWEALHGTMYRTALATFGKRSSKSHDWFEVKSAVMTPVNEAKRAALAEYNRPPSDLQILRIARSKAQQTAWRCANEYWTELSENIQSAAITGNIRGMYDGIRKAVGPTLNKTAPRSSTWEVTTEKRQSRRNPQTKPNPRQ